MRNFDRERLREMKAMVAKLDFDADPASACPDFAPRAPAPAPRRMPARKGSSWRHVARP